MFHVFFDYQDGNIISIFFLKNSIYWNLYRISNNTYNILKRTNRCHISGFSWSWKNKRNVCRYTVKKKVWLDVFCITLIGNVDHRYRQLWLYLKYKQRQSISKIKVEGFIEFLTMHFNFPTCLRAEKKISG